jgi:hypothetical protein
MLIYRFVRCLVGEPLQMLGQETMTNVLTRPARFRSNQKPQPSLISRGLAHRGAIDAAKEIFLTLPFSDAVRCAVCQ